LGPPLRRNEVTDLQRLLDDEAKPSDAHSKSSDSSEVSVNASDSESAGGPSSSNNTIALLRLRLAQPNWAPIWPGKTEILRFPVWFYYFSERTHEEN
jgi:hypothetical protein